MRTDYEIMDSLKSFQGLKADKNEAENYLLFIFSSYPDYYIHEIKKKTVVRPLILNNGNNNSVDLGNDGGLFRQIVKTLITQRSMKWRHKGGRREPASCSPSTELVELQRKDAHYGTKPTPNFLRSRRIDHPDAHRARGCVQAFRY